jgi:hypothetical protein
MTVSENPTVTVLTAVYNGAPYLPDSISSILGQTFGDFEFIIIDDASTDETPILLSQFARRDARIRIVTNQKKAGLAKSLNLGLVLASAPLIARHDADDVSEPSRLTKQVAFMNSHRDIGVLGSAMTLIDDSGNCLQRHWNMPLSHPSITWGMLFFSTVAHPSVMYRQHVVGAGVYSEEQTASEDLNLWFDLMLQGARFANLPDRLVRYRIHPGQTGQVKKSESLNEAKAVRGKFLERIAGQAFGLQDIELFLSMPRRSDCVIGASEFWRIAAFGLSRARDFERLGIVSSHELWTLRRAWLVTLRSAVKSQAMHWANRVLRGRSS